jgi:hypothetical protein
MSEQTMMIYMALFAIFNFIDLVASVYLYMKYNQIQKQLDTQNKLNSIQSQFNKNITDIAGRLLGAKNDSSSS